MAISPPLFFELFSVCIFFSLSEEGNATADFTLLCIRGLKSKPESALLAYRIQIQVSDPECKASEIGNTWRLPFPIGRGIFFCFLFRVGFLLGDRCVFLMCVPCICAFSQKSLP
jgi:hypothetical protein